MICAQWHEMVKEPCMFYCRYLVRFQPDAQYLRVGSVLWRCFDTKAQMFPCCHTAYSSVRCYFDYIRSRGSKPKTRRTLFIVCAVACTSSVRNALTCSFVSLRIGDVCSKKSLK